MSPTPRPRAVIVVDLNAQNGVCTNCNQAAAIGFSHAACGAEVVGVAIDTQRVNSPTFEEGVGVNSKLPMGMAFLGAGRVERHGSGYRFRRTLRPDMQKPDAR